jgi:hypothetical protein
MLYLGGSTRRSVSMDRVVAYIQSRAEKDYFLISLYREVQNNVRAAHGTLLIESERRIRKLQGCH